jgi:hypothetical protein
VRQAPKWADGPVLRRPSQQTKVDAPQTKLQRRSALRRTGNPVDVQITDSMSKSPAPAVVIDRSLRGLCIAIDHPHRVGSLVNVRPVKSDRSTEWVSVKVRNCRYVGRAYELGCEFEKVPPASVLILFG